MAGGDVPHQVFKDKGRYVRWRSRESILDEIDALLDNQFVTVLHFIDDSFGANQGWLVELVRALLARRGSPVALQANIRADLVTEELCAALGEYGADKLRLRIAVETGNEEYRRRILKKNISDEELVGAADTLNRYGIDFVTYNMLGLPGESYADALETLRFNCRLKPALALCFVFQPFSGTELARYAVEKGFLPPENFSKMGTAEYGGFFFSRSPLKQPGIGKVENLHAVFGFVVENPFLMSTASAVCRIEVMAPLFRLFYRLYLRRLLARRREKDSY